MLWRETPVYVIDLEGNRSYGIVEYGVVVIRDGLIVSTYTRLCHPRGEIPFEESRLHGITDGEANQSPPFSDDWEMFRDFRAHGPFCAHHAPFEHGLLKDQWAFPPFSPDFSRASHLIADWGPWLDTRRLAEVLYPGLQNYKLANVIKFMGLDADLSFMAEQYCPERRRQYHCALFDALASALILVRSLSASTLSDASLQRVYTLLGGRSGYQDELSFPGQG